MKKILIIGILSICLTSVHGYTQMGGGGMMGGQQSGTMQGQGMMGGMMQMMNQMAGMMQNISGMMREGMSAEEIREM
jgi:acyl-[acyl carrier protein]--UDP-N-acetylglucosamine O-acyltransferase